MTISASSLPGNQPAGRSAAGSPCYVARHQHRREMNVFCEAEGRAHRLSMASPVLMHTDFEQLLSRDPDYYRAEHLSLCFDPRETTLEQAIRTLCDNAEAAVRAGAVLVVLSDRQISPTPCRSRTDGSRRGTATAGQPEPAL